MPAINANDASHVLREIYDREYGIFHHTRESSKTRPLASIAMHYAESPEPLLSVKNYIAEYIKLELFKFGITLEVYLNMPADVAKAIVLEVEEKKRVQNQQVDAALQGLNN